MVRPVYFFKLYRFFRGKYPDTLYSDPEFTRTRKNSIYMAWGFAKKNERRPLSLDYWRTDKSGRWERIEL